MISAGDVAKFFLWKYGDDDQLSNLKIQKLLYYAQGYHYAKFDDPLFYEPLQAWRHGPVVRAVYNAYSANDSDPLPKPVGFDPNRVPVRELGLLHRVYKAYGQYTAWKLRQMTHEEPPYLMAYAEGENSEISPESMKAFFKARLQILPTTAYTPVEARIQAYTNQYSNAFGRKREAVRAMLVRLVSNSQYQARYLGHATKLILSSPLQGKIDEAVSLFVNSGPDALGALVSETLPLMPPDEENGDYWYVIIRAMGFLGQSSEVTQFINSPHVRVREAVVEALGDLGDEYSLSLLKNLSDTDTSNFIQRIARETLEDRATA